MDLEVKREAAPPPPFYGSRKKGGWFLPTWRFAFAFLLTSKQMFHKASLLQNITFQRKAHSTTIFCCLFPHAKCATCSYKHIATRKGAETTALCYEAFAVLGSGCRERSSTQLTLKHPLPFACQILSHLPSRDKIKDVSQ